MLRTNEVQFEEPIIIIEEKGDIEHAIRCTEQALKRTNIPWLKKHVPTG